MKRIPPIFLTAFLADGLLSLAAIAIPSLSVLQQIYAVLVFLAAALLHLVMALTPRLPKRFLFPATVFALWCAVTNAFPSSLVFGNQAGLVMACTQVFLGAGLLLLLKRSTLDPGSRPAFSWANFSTVSGCNVFLGLAFALLLVLSGLSMVETKTAGFVRIRPEGISLEERWFERSDGKSVRLVGMVHVAKGQFYEDLQATLPEKESAIVLLEGITDHDALLEEKLSYSNLADSFGLASQTDSEFMKNAARKSRMSGEKDKAGSGDKNGDSRIQYWRADVDTSDFQDSTIACIEAVGKLFASKSMKEVLERLSDRNSPLNQKADNEIFWSDVVDLRNEHLIGEMEDALRNTNIVIVPWGALHMPVFEQKLKDWGFKETHRARRLAFSFEKKPLPQVPSLP